jgi:hypothetical protein
MTGQQQPNLHPSSFPAWVMVRVPVGRAIEELEKDVYLPQPAVVYLIAEKRDHYLGHVTHTDEHFVWRRYERRRLKHPSKIVKANVIHIFPHTTDPKDRVETEDRIYEIAVKFAHAAGSKPSIAMMGAKKRSNILRLKTFVTQSSAMQLARRAQS